MSYYPRGAMQAASLPQSLDKEIEEKVLQLSHEFAMRLVDAPDADPNPLVSQTALKKKVELAQKEALLGYMNRLSIGLQEFSHFREKLANFEPELFTPEVIAELERFTSNPVDLQRLALDSLNQIDEQRSIRELLALSHKTPPALYRLAVDIYNSQRYEEASSALTTLALLDATAYNVWIALGSSEYHCNRYAQALVAYSMAAKAGPDNPIVHLYSAHCYEGLGDYQKAVESLEHLLLLISDRKEYKELIQQAKEYKASLL
jgi:tetratricopeptide (TPR) repeat protein